MKTSNGFPKHYRPANCLHGYPPWTYVNISGQRFKGIELEAKRFHTQNWHVLGSLMYQNN